VARLNDVDFSASTGPRRRVGGRRLQTVCDVTRDHQALTRPDLPRFTDAIGLHDSRGRHVMFVRNAVDGVAIADRHRGTAIPGPMARSSWPSYVSVVTA